MKQEGRRLKILSLPISHFESVLRTGYRATHYDVAEGIPPDGRIVLVVYDHNYGRVDFVVHSETYPEIPEEVSPDITQLLVRTYTMSECPWDNPTVKVMDAWVVDEATPREG